jgi:hypothetical protein
MEITPEQRERWAARDENRRFKAWIDPHVCENGRLSLRLLYDFARKHGVPIDEAAYTNGPNC